MFLMTGWYLLPHFYANTEKSAGRLEYNVGKETIEGDANIAQQQGQPSSWAYCDDMSQTFSIYACFMLLYIDSVTFHTCGVIPSYVCYVVGILLCCLNVFGWTLSPCCIQSFEEAPLPSRVASFNIGL